MWLRLRVIEAAPMVQGLEDAAAAATAHKRRQGPMVIYVAPGCPGGSVTLRGISVLPKGHSCDFCVNPMSTMS